MIADSMVSFKGVNNTYLPPSGPVHALDRINLDIASGEFITVVGRSGCGKSTLLNLVAGFERSDSGEILVSNCKISGPGLDRGVVFKRERRPRNRAALY